MSWQTSSQAQAEKPCPRYPKEGNGHLTHNLKSGIPTHSPAEKECRPPLLPQMLFWSCAPVSMYGSITPSRWVWLSLGARAEYPINVTKALQFSSYHAGIGWNASRALGDSLTYRPKGHSQLRELWFSYVHALYTLFGHLWSAALVPPS